MTNIQDLLHLFTDVNDRLPEEQSLKQCICKNPSNGRLTIHLLYYIKEDNEVSEDFDYWDCPVEDLDDRCFNIDYENEKVFFKKGWWYSQLNDYTGTVFHSIENTVVLWLDLSILTTKVAAIKLAEETFYFANSETVDRAFNKGLHSKAILSKFISEKQIEL